MNSQVSSATTSWAILALAAVGCAGRVANSTTDRTASTVAATPAPAGTATPIPEAAWRPLDRELASTPTLLAAGLCGLDPYLNQPCDGLPSPHFAVLLLATEDVAAVENALHKAGILGLAAGYPFAASFDDLRTHDPSRRGIAVVAGLFAEREDAERYREHLPAGAELVELTLEEEPFDFDNTSVVVVTEPATAWSYEDLDRVEKDLDETLAKKWVTLPKQRERRLAALAKLTPRCVVAPGRVSWVRKRKLHAFLQNYAPVSCADGREAWIEWRATRLESVVTRSGGVILVHQVVLVECDVPTIETRRWGAPLAAKPLGLSRPGRC